MGSLILIIDDEPDICRLLKMSLSRDGYQVKYVHGLNEGLAFIEEEEPDILFLDIHLPDGSGLAALPFIKENHDNIIIVTISAFDAGYEKEAALSSGASYFLPKPFNIKSLKDLMLQLHE